jgi:hypothetical protein
MLIAAREEIEIAVCEWLQMQEPHFYKDGIFKLMHTHLCAQGLC